MELKVVNLRCLIVPNLSLTLQLQCGGWVWGFTFI